MIGPKNQDRIFSFLPGCKTVQSFHKKNIAIITPDIVGPKHGGIGTAYANLAEALSQAGHKITLVFFPSVEFSDKEIEPWVKNYQEKGIFLIVLKISKEISSTQSHLLRHAHRSLTVYEWLKKCSSPFDIVHFPEWSGIGYYSLLAHREGLLFPESRFVVGVHSSTRWVQSFNDDRIFRRQQDLETVFMEEESIRLADVVISPSRYYLEWLNSQSVSLPENSYFIPNILLDCAQEHPVDSESAGETDRIREVVFFGRIEARKGVVLFCDAIEQSNIKNRDGITITFLGSLNHVYGIPSKSYLEMRATKWKVRTKILSQYGRKEALAYLSQPGRLAVMPTFAETMSYAVLECLGRGIPFLASKVGGIPELIEAQDLERVCFNLDPSELSKRLELALVEKPFRARPSMNPQEIKDRWIGWHEQEKSIKASGNPSPIKKTVSVCLCLDSLGGHSLEILEALKKQSCLPDEVIVSIPGNLLKNDSIDGKLVEFISRNGWKIMREDFQSRFLLWERIFNETSGEVLIFLDEKTIPFQDTTEKFIDVYQKTGADLLTASLIVEPESGKTNRKDFLGGAISSGFFGNIFGEGIFLISKNGFDKIREKLQGISSDPPEWGLFANSILSGLRLETIPEPLARLIKCRSQGEKEYKISPDQHPYFPSIYPPIKDLMIYVKSVQNLLRQTPDGSFIVSPQRIVDEYTESRLFQISVKILAPLRKAIGKPIKIQNSSDTLSDSIEILQKLHSSPEGILASLFSLAKSIFRK